MTAAPAGSPPRSPPGSAALLRAFHRRRWLNFWSLWLSYAAFYTCRQNLAVAQPSMAADLGFSKVDLGLLSTVFAVAYAVGQVVNGQLADRLGGRRLLRAGMVLAAAANLAFGLSSSLAVLAVIWGLNGLVLATGVPSMARINANWFALHERGRYLGLYSTCGQAGAVFGLALAGLVLSLAHWRFAFFMPAVVILLVALQASLLLAERPTTLGFPPVEPQPAKAGQRGEGAVEAPTARGASPSGDGEAPAGFATTIRLVLRSRPIWIMAMTYLLLGVVRNGLLTWAPTYFNEVHGAPLDQAAYRTAVLPLAGCLGSIVAGWASDRLFDSRRAPVCVLMLAGLGITLAVSWAFPGLGATPSMVVLGVAGFAMLGPYTLITTCAALDFGSRQAAASASGFIDAMAYVGMAFAGVGLGWVLREFGWSGGFAVWVGAAWLAAGLMALLWNARPEAT